MTMLASQITSLMVVYSIVYSGVNQRKHQSSASLAFVREIHRGPVNFPHKWPVTRKMFPFDDVIMFFFIWMGCFDYLLPQRASPGNVCDTLQALLLRDNHSPQLFGGNAVSATHQIHTSKLAFIHLSGCDMVTLLYCCLIDSYDWSNCYHQGY